MASMGSKYFRIISDVIFCYLIQVLRNRQQVCVVPIPKLRAVWLIPCLIVFDLSAVALNGPGCKVVEGGHVRRGAGSSPLSSGAWIRRVCRGPRWHMTKGENEIIHIILFCYGDCPIHLAPIELPAGRLKRRPGSNIPKTVSGNLKIGEGCRAIF